MRRRQTKGVPVQGLLLVREVVGQEEPHHDFIRTACRSRIGKERFQFGSEKKKVPVPVVVEGYYTERVTRAEKPLPLAVPQREAEVAEQMFRDLITPEPVTS